MGRTSPATLTIAPLVAILLASCSSGSSEPSASPRSTVADTTAAPSTTDESGGRIPGLGTDPPTAPFGRSALLFFDDCDALLDHYHRIGQDAVGPWGFDGGGWYGPVLEGEVAAAEEAADDTGGSDAAVADDGGGAATPEYSTTNTQEVGVDEGDVVETDGEYVYTVVPEGFRVVSIADAEVVARPTLPGGEHDLLLDVERDRLVVASRTWDSWEETVVSLYDVADPRAPQLLRRSHLEGRLVASRASDGVARLVLVSGAPDLPFTRPGEFGVDEERALDDNRALVAATTIDDWLPRRFDEDADGTPGEIERALECSAVAAPSDFSGTGTAWIAAIDLDAGGDVVGSAGVISTGETVYAAPDSLYVATTVWPGWGESFDQQPPTTIHRFDLDGTSASFVASGAVPGRLLNQFAMSEHEGDLRVAVTVDDWQQGDSESSVHVLRPVGDELVEISSVGGLGRGEQIHAVRFLGPTAYVVTFRQIDPLYVIDLSDPAAPVMRGELKIPGYSAYLHPVGDGLLLGVGQDATTDGRTLGTQLSLFDVTDPTDPQRIDTLAIGGSSEVEWDHRAFLYWPADGSIVLPVSPGWGDCVDGQEVCLADQLGGDAGGVVVARLDGRSLTPVGAIGQGPTRGCWNPLRRSIVVDDELITVGFDQLRISALDDLETRATVSWGEPEEFGCWWWVD